LPKQPKCDAYSQKDADPVKVVGTDYKFALHERMKETAGVRTAVAEFARFLDIDDDFRNGTPIVALLWVANSEDGIFWFYLGVYVVTFKVKAMGDIL
jgi:hypothetical protein